MIFYVEAQIHYMQYEQLDGTFDYRGLIEANDLDQARKKFTNHWSNKTDKYYTILDLTIVEPIT